jgi:hypothetical protein
MTLEVENGTLCPNCKKKALVPCRTRENNPAIDGMKCKNCAAFYRWSESHHLIALVTPPVLKSDRGTDVVVAAAPVAVVEAPPAKPAIVLQPKEKRTYKLTPKQRDEINKRLLAGEDVVKIVADYDVTKSNLYAMRLKLGIRKYKVGRNTPAKHPPVKVVASPAVLGIAKTDAKKGESVLVEEEPEPMKSLTNKPKQVYNTNQGNIMSQMARLRRGEIRTKAAGPVLSRYRKMLEAELKATQSKAKEIKQKIGAADDALNALDAISKGEKDIVEKVMASVI